MVILLKLEDHKFKTTLTYTESARLCSCRIKPCLMGKNKLRVALSVGVRGEAHATELLLQCVPPGHLQ